MSTKNTNPLGVACRLFVSGALGETGPWASCVVDHAAFATVSNGLSNGLRNTHLAAATRLFSVWCAVAVGVKAIG
jgi:hypothetical protein